MSYPQIYIKDTGSSNGTYINNQRLSPSGKESAPALLSTGALRLSVCLSVFCLGAQLHPHRPVAGLPRDCREAYSPV